MLIDFILIKENSTELIVVGDYNNEIEFFADNLAILPDKINRMWRFDFEDKTYKNDTYRIILTKRFNELIINLNNCELNYDNFKNLRKGKYEYHKYRMFLDTNKVYVEKKHLVRSR